MAGTSLLHRLGGVRALSSSNFRIYMAGHAFGLLGVWIHRIAMGWLTWELTRSGTWLGVVAAADMLPAVLLGPLGGAVADRWNRLRLAKLLQVTLIVHAALLTGLAFGGGLGIGLLTALALARGILVAFWQPIRLSLVPSLVPREDLSAAIAMNAALFNGAMFVGPALAVPIIAWDIGAAFGVYGILLLVSLASLTRLRLPSTRHAPSRGSMLVQTVQGIRFALSRQKLRAPLLTALVVAITVRSVLELLPGFAAAVFDGGASELGVMTSSFGLGALAVALWMTWRGERTNPAFAASLGGLSAGVGVSLFAAATSFPLALACLFLAGGALTMFSVGNQIILQSAVPDEMRGRVLSLFGLVVRSTPALGAVVLGAASEYLGLRTPVLSAALIGLAVVGWSAWRRGHRPAR